MDTTGKIILIIYVIGYIATIITMPIYIYKDRGILRISDILKAFLLSITSWAALAIILIDYFEYTDLDKIITKRK